MPIYELGCEPAHECELLCLPRLNLQNARLQSRKGLLHQLVGSYHGDAAALRKIPRHVGLHRRGHQLDNLDAGVLQLETQGLGVRVNRRLGGAVDRSLLLIDKVSKAAPSTRLQNVTLAMARAQIAMHWNRPDEALEQIGEM